MKTFLVTLVLSLSLTTPPSAFAFLGMNAGATLQGALPVWTLQQGGARTEKAATSANVAATDPSGNIIVAGTTKGDLDGNNLSFIQNTDYFVSKYNSAGTKLWTRQQGAATNSTTTYASGVATDSSGNIFVTGYTSGGLDGNTRTGYEDFFVAKYDSSGTKLWTKQLGVASHTTHAGRVATDSSGNVFVSGSTDGGLDGNTLTGWEDFFVTKYDSSGTKLWTKQLGVASAFAYAGGVATDSSGNVFVSGYTTGGLDGNSLTGMDDFFVTKYNSSGTKLWTKQLGVASKITYGFDAATDSSGNVFVTGITNGGLDGNSLTGTYDSFVTKYDPSGTKLWTKQIGVASKDTDAHAVSTDSSGNVFIAGKTYGGLDGNSLTGSDDFFVTKYDASGTKLWTKQLGVASQKTEANGVATDSSGSVFVAGYEDGGLDGNTLTGTSDLFITKYDSTGSKTWTKQLGALRRVNINSATGTVDSAGNLFIAGSTDGGMDGNTQAGIWDFFVTKYDTSGTKLWTRQLGASSAHVYPRGVSTDSSGNVFVAGETDSALDGNTMTGWSDLFITKYDSSGTKQWTKQLDAASTDVYTYASTTDPSGNVIAAGSTDGNLDGNTLAGYTDLYVTKYNSAGTKLWTRTLGAASIDTEAFAVTTDPSGNIFVTGYTDGGLDGNSLTGSIDFFVTKYDSSGTKIWTRQMGVASHKAEAYGIATDSSGNIYVAGYTNGALDGNSLTGTSDFFVTKYDPSGTKVWTKLLGTASQQTSATGIATDSFGNIFVTGWTGGGLDGNALTGTLDLFVTKFTSAGVRQWTKQMGATSSTTSASSVSVHSSGRYYVVGTSTGALDFLSPTGSPVAVACKYIGN